MRRVSPAVALALLLVAQPARADIVKLTNGRTLNVDSCVFEGKDVIFKMPGGGEIRMAKNLVDEVLPDESRLPRSWRSKPWPRRPQRIALNLGWASSRRSSNSSPTRWASTGGSRMRS